MEHIPTKLWPSNRLKLPLWMGGISLGLVGFDVCFCVKAEEASPQKVAGSGVVEQLACRVRSLSEALVSAKIENDYLKARIERSAYGMVDAWGSWPDESAMVREKDYLILDVNKELGMVILNGGRQDGIKPGLVFNVIREDRSVATVRVVDVRAKIAGAVIRGEGRELPKVQDRAIVAAGSKN